MSAKFFTTLKETPEIYCIADDFCKEYELELRKKAISCSHRSENSPSPRNRKGRMSDAKMITILVLFRSNMKNRLMDIHDKIMLRKRGIIETINDMLKNVVQIVHTRQRKLSGFIVNLLAGMAAYAFYDTKPTINVEFEWEETSSTKQLTLF